MHSNLLSMCRRLIIALMVCLCVTAVLGNLGTLILKIVIDFEWEKSRLAKINVPRFPKTAVAVVLCYT